MRRFAIALLNAMHYVDRQLANAEISLLFSLLAFDYDAHPVAGIKLGHGLALKRFLKMTSRGSSSFYFFIRKKNIKSDFNQIFTGFLRVFDEFQQFL